MNIWDAPEEIKSIVEDLKGKYHPHLANANIWTLLSDGKYLKDNKLRPIQAKKCSATEKYKTKGDFKIIISAEGWKVLTDKDRKIAIDEALCCCGVKFEPMVVVVNNKKEKVKDDIGRIVYTTNIVYDKNNAPKWKINKPDAEAYFSLAQRHKVYSEDLENVNRAVEGLPLKLPTAATQPDADDGVNEGEE